MNPINTQRILDDWLCSQIRNKNLIALYSEDRIIQEPWYKQLWWCLINQGVIQGKINETFTIKECNDKCFDILSCFHPNSNTIKSSIYRSLQKLRDNNILEFVDNRGSYKVVSHY